MIVHPDCQDYSITSLKQYTWEDDLYLTGACLPTAGRIATYVILMCFFGTAMCIGWYSIAMFWSKTKDFSFLKKISSQTLFIWTITTTFFFLTYVFFLFRPHPSVAPVFLSLASTVGQYALYMSSEAWFHSLEGTKSSAGNNLQEMTGKVLQELRWRARIVLSFAGVICMVGHIIAAVGLGVFNSIKGEEMDLVAAQNNGSLGALPAAVTAYGLTVAGMATVHLENAVSVVFLCYFIYKYGYILADMIMDTVQKMSASTGRNMSDASGASAPKKSAYDKMEARAQEVRAYCGRSTPFAAVQVASINLALGLWGLASLSSPQGAGYCFWLFSAKSMFNSFGCLQSVRMFGLMPLMKEKEKNKPDNNAESSRRPSEAASIASRAERAKSIAAANKRDSMHESSSIQKTAEMKEDSGKPVLLNAGESIGSPTTAKTLVTVPEEKPEPQQEKASTSEEAPVVETTPAPEPAQLDPHPNREPEIVVIPPSEAAAGIPALPFEAATAPSVSLMTDANGMGEAPVVVITSPSNNDVAGSS